MALVIFDLDGTLVDSARDLAESTNELLESLGARALPERDVLGMVGEGAKKLVERALAAAGLDPDEPAALARFRAIYDRRLLNHTRPYDGIPDAVVAASQRASLAVLTNKPEPPARRMLDAFGLLAHFRWVIGGDALYPRKPDPASVQHLMQDAGAGPASTLFVGDSIVDVQTARNAEIRVCLARYGFGHLRGEPGLTEADWTIDDPRQLVAVLDEAFASIPNP